MCPPPRHHKFGEKKKEETAGEGFKKKKIMPRIQ